MSGRTIEIPDDHGYLSLSRDEATAILSAARAVLKQWKGVRTEDKGQRGQILRQAIEKMEAAFGFGPPQ